MDLENEKRESDQIARAIVDTVAYFDLFDYPLTGQEIWKFLGVKCDLEDVKLMLLEKDELLKSIGEKDGLYFFTGRENIIQTRAERYNFTERKFKLAKRVAKLFYLIPWIKFIGVGNIMGDYNLKDESDIDFFIVTEKKKIWLTRFFCASLMQLLGLRPKPDNMRDKICLSFFVSEESINLEKYTLPGGKDIYFIYWLAGLFPIYNTSGVYKEFNEANIWLSQHLPNWRPDKFIDVKKISKTYLVYKKALSILLGSLENLFKKLQLKLMPKQLRELANKSTDVIIDDEILKLHVNDRRREYKEKWLRRIKDFK